MSDVRTGQGSRNTHRTEDFSRLTFSVKEAAEKTGSSKSYIYNLINAGTLESRLVGSKRVISAASLERVFTK